MRREEGGHPHEEVGAKFIEEVGSRITQGSKAPKQTNASWVPT
jgi:hypothetical protein